MIDASESSTIHEQSQNPIHETIDDALAKGRRTWRDFREGGERLLDQARHKSDELWEDTRTLVQKYPGRAVGLALLIGSVCAALLAQATDER